MSSFAPIRDGSGGIIGMQERDASQFAQTLAATMKDVGAEEAAPEEEETRAVWRPGRREAASLVGGLVLAVALIGLLNMFAPAPAPRLASPTAQNTDMMLVFTATPTPAPTPTATLAPTQAPPTATPEPPTAVPPTPEPVYVPPPTPEPPPCDPAVAPRFSVHLDVSPIGSVTGVSCESVEEAQANASALQAAMLATAEGR